MNSFCASVGREVTCDSRDRRFESSHRQLKSNVCKDAWLQEALKCESTSKQTCDVALFAATYSSCTPNSKHQLSYCNETDWQTVYIWVSSGGGGQAVSVLAVYSVDTSSNPAEVYKFNHVNCLNRTKEAGYGPFKNCFHAADW